MQGVRRAEPQLGETACVIGLGLIGQLVVRLLVAAGVQVVGLDTVEARCRAAEKAGALACAAPGRRRRRAGRERASASATGGLGADHVLLAAGGDSNGPVEVAARLARDRARVVDIGKTRLDLPWNAYYEKELDVRFSRSYGPGRYDDRYELDGHRLPGRLRPLDRAPQPRLLPRPARRGPGRRRAAGVGRPPDRGGRRRLRPARVRARSRASGTCSPTRTATDAGRGGTRAIAADRSALRPPRARRRVARRAAAAGRLRRGRQLRHARCCCRTCATTRGSSWSRWRPRPRCRAVNAQRKFGFRTVSTDVDAVLDDDSLDAVFVVTRHELARRARLPRPRTGPGRLRREAARADRRAARRGPGRRRGDRQRPADGRLQPPVRPAVRRAARRASVRSDGPISARYLVNAGQLAAGSWYLNAELEGSRFVGEGGHFVDTAERARSGATPSRSTPLGAGPTSTPRCATPTARSASITYVTGGSARFPKETLDVAGGRPQRPAGQLPAGHGVVRRGRRRTSAR